MKKSISKLIEAEKQRQEDTIDLIASENYTSKEVLSALGSVFVNKYAEGYPGKRFYRGNKVVDRLEKRVQNQALKLFGLDGWSVNVQPYSGSIANLGVYHALLSEGDKIMGMELSSGGHLTHGSSFNLSGKLWKTAEYKVDKQTEKLDYEKVQKKAMNEGPDLIITGYSAYSRFVDFEKFRRIADEVGAYLMADISHVAGLVATEFFPSPFEYADVVTSTTHKTLRGPRSALIFSKKDLADGIDRTVFPGLQGGPHMNQIAAVGVCLEEASKPDFKTYVGQVVENAKTLMSALKELGWRVISGGTDTHLFLIDVTGEGLSGKEASNLLEESGIIANKNSIPFDERPPKDPSGIRLGTPAVTTRGMEVEEMREIGDIIDGVLKKRGINAKEKVRKLCQNHPIY